jgi:hypothetical protein
MRFSDNFINHLYKKNQMNWYEELGFKRNPLDIRPNTGLVGLEKEEKQLVNHILKEEICFINGLTGSGKSSLLMKAKELIPDHEFIYLDAHELPNDFNLEKELMDKRGFFDRLFMRKYPKKKPVLIIDEFQSTDQNLVLEARAGWENPVERKIKAIVIAQISRFMKNVTPSFKERLGSRIITLRPLEDDEMKEILKKRLFHKKKNVNYLNKLDDEAVSFIIRCSGNNPRRMLEYADDIFDFHHMKFADLNPIFKDDYVVSYHAAKEILGIEQINVEGFNYDGSEHDAEDKITGTAMFEKMYSPKERKALRIMENMAKSAVDIADGMDISETSANSIIYSLKKKHAIVSAGKDGRKKLWEVAPEIKRVMVNV